ncbi:helix-turn-helix transcriptional regulator [Rhizosphaericola mali]|uniref:WYL domain-containing protein n=1 Tax=Rhizosphaericola mali TaxID=2545455 RepID=A0A5P2G4C0_9BACT|nr:WYL domain-containing protein [Rhizosphaericola mali]QES90674.1 WYL domain-containing protein [Rhizosphaericola mali]
MSVNKLALIRYKVIDDCLRNKMRKWTLEDLIDKVSDVLYEREGIENGVSKRTIQGDIQIMRSDKLGYNAPIEVAERKFYFYSEEDFSITKAPISEADVDKLKEVIDLLKQFNAFNYLDDMSEMIARLENNLYKSTRQTINYIQFEENAQLKGLHFITPLYQYIRSQKSIAINYRSFKAQAAATKIYYPYLLKEYRNRWFLICASKKGKELYNLALDRMISVEEAKDEPFFAYEGVDFERYYDEVIGVTKSKTDRAHKVVLHFNKSNSPYVLTKPIHPSQQLLKEDETGILIRIDVVLNFELEREILGFGESVKVISPRLLESRIKKRLQYASDNYLE